MNRHLSTSDYSTLPWANGLGKTVEMLRLDDGKENLLLRLSTATITENGPFSVFNNINRNLTVLTGEGFDLQIDEENTTYSASQFTPIEFSGEKPVTARNVKSTCQVLNVMTRSDLPKPSVWVEQDVLENKIVEGRQLAFFALSASIINTSQETFHLQEHELLLWQENAVIVKGNIVCISFA